MKHLQLRGLRAVQVGGGLQIPVEGHPDRPALPAHLLHSAAAVRPDLHRIGVIDVIAAVSLHLEQ